MAVRLRVDPIRCDGFGHCAELAPELIALDEWGYPILTPEPLDATGRSLASTVIAQCPRKALFLETLERSEHLSRARR
jgi:ferredoxin